MRRSALVVVANAALLCICTGAAAAAPAAERGLATSSVAAHWLGTDALLVPELETLASNPEPYLFASALVQSPRAFGVRWRSRTAYRRLTTGSAARLAARAFPVLSHSDTGLPRLPPGDHVLRYLTPTAAQVALPRGKRAVVESLGSMARRVGRHRFVAINLALRQSALGFAPIAPQADVQIPRHLSTGVSVAGADLRIVPVDARRRPLRGDTASTEGASVFYANTQTDADTTVKPTASGVDIGAILRSVASPNTLTYRITAPSPVRLVVGANDIVRVLVRGAVVGYFFAPTAVDAKGMPVPVSMAVHGSELVVSVLPSGATTWPVYVDPSFGTKVDEELEGGCYGNTLNGILCSEGHTNWKLIPPNSQVFAFESCYCGGIDGNGYVRWSPRQSYGAGQAVGIQYETQGESRVYAFRSTSEGTYTNPGWVSMEIWSHSGMERKNWTYLNQYETGHYPGTTATICAINVTQNCEPSYGTPGNEARFVTSTTGAGSAGGFSQEVSKAWVWISQEHAPQLSFNTSSPTIKEAGGRSNVLYGAGSWIGPYSGAMEATAVDQGVGVSRFEANIGGYWVGGSWPLEEAKCAGVQCKQSYATPLTYNSRMPNGEDELEINASNGVGLGTYNVTHKLKVDAAPPYNLTATGWPPSREISAAPHTVSIEATDGKAPTPSSGVKSLTVKINGEKETLIQGASCGPGPPCTASGKFTINAQELPEGVNRLIITATDNANNVAASEATFDVRAPTPMSVGPGAVDPISGQYQLAATDISLGGVASVGRAYRSRSITAGEGGPLGPQWTMSLGGREGLRMLADGSMILTAASGSQTTFARNSSGEFESPLGDSVLKLEAVSSNGQTTEFLLKDIPAGTTTHFTQPPGTQNTTPTFVGQFGNEDSPPRAPQTDTVDRKGNVWATDPTTDRLEEYSPGGFLIAAYGRGTPGRREFSGPWGITTNPSTGNVYVTDQGNNRVEELNNEGTFLATFGWGVADGKQEYEICSNECKAGSPGAGAGQLNGATGITTDPSGNVWVADTANNRLEEFSAEGRYVQTINSGSSLHKGPVALASNGTKLDVVTTTASTIQEISTAGKLEREIGAEGHGNGQLQAPSGIATDSNGDVYVADSGNNRVEEFGSTGTFVANIGSKGSGPGQLSEPTGVAVGPSGGIYAADYKNDRLEEWARARWSPTVSEGTLTSGVSTQSYIPVELGQGEAAVFPSEITAPAPVGVSCGAKPSELKKGCRALLFEYASETNAGEAQNEWRDFKGRLKRVRFAGYNPASGKMEEPVVAEYAYDAQGRLRTEWDPRIKPELKTTYGYDEQGHVTAVTDAGQETWALTYGTIAGDRNTGRLLKAMQAPPATSLWKGATIANLSKPAITGSPNTGVQLGVSRGSWSTEPVAYGYQWEDCAGSQLSECTPIPGATNANYRAQTSDIGQHLAALVTATNAGGSASVLSATTATVKASESGTTDGTHYPPEPGWTLEYNVPVTGAGAPNQLGASEVAAWAQTDDATTATALFPPDEPVGWPAPGYERATISYLDEQARTVNTATPASGNTAITTTEYNSTNEPIRTLTADNRAAALASHPSASAAETLDTRSIYNGLGQLTETLGPLHQVKLAHGKKAAGEEVQARHRSLYSYDEGAPGGGLYDLVTKKTESALTQKGETFDQRTTVSSYNGQGSLGWKLRKPTAVTVDSGGLALTTTTRYDPASGNPTEVIPPGSANSLLPLYATRFGASGQGAGNISSGSALTQDDLGNIWVADTANNRVDEFTSSGSFIEAFGWGVNLGEERLEVCTLSCRAGIGGSEKTKKGQLLKPAGITYNPATGALYVADTGNNQIAEFSVIGKGLKLVKVYGKLGTGRNRYNSPEGLIATSTGNIWVADRGNHRVVQISGKGKYIGAVGVGKGQYGDVAVCRGKLFATDTATQRVDEIGTEGAETILTTFGGAGSENGQFTQIGRIGCDPQNGDLYVTDSSAGRVQVFTRTGNSVGALSHKGANPGELLSPLGVMLDSSGTMYVLDSSTGQISQWAPDAGTGTNGPGTHGGRTSYYTAEGESPVPGCRNHPEWADLVCQTDPIAQPEAPGLPKLPVTTYTYNLWDETATKTETVGSTTRETTQTYDSAGRVSTTSVAGTHTIDSSLPTVTDEYNSATGMLEHQSTTTNGHTATITLAYNTIGQLESYTDAAGATTTYEYEPEGNERLKRISDPTGSQLYTYNPTSGLREQLVDSTAGTFTANYDVEGRLTSETYPNNMTARYTYNPLGATVGLEYIKNAHCAKACPETWYEDKITPAIGGETLQQTSTLAKEAYSYDTAGRLTETQETPTGKPCTSRLYAYDDESNRLTLTTRQATGETCAPNGGTSENHAYDTANRLADPGLAYEELGNITSTPAADAGGHQITSSFYIDNQVATQAQNGETLSYNYDPEGRTLETTSQGKTTGTTVTHYPGPGEAVSWLSETSERWTRQIPGPDGTLTATATNLGTVTLLLHDLTGNVVATAARSETEPALLSTYNSTEFGAPSEGKTPPRYAWLGAGGITSEPSFESGAIIAHGASYVPQVARTLQTAPITPPGAHPFGVGETNPYSREISAAVLASAEAEAQQAFAEAEAARQAALLAMIGAEEDPEGILTGKGALKFAEALDTEARAIKIAAGNGLGSMPGTGQDAADILTELLENGAETEEGGADLLRKCYADVHNGWWITIGKGIFKQKFFQTGVCYYDYKWRPLLGFTIVTQIKVAICKSSPQWGVTQEWYCPDKLWWHFTGK